MPTETESTKTGAIPSPEASLSEEGVAMSSGEGQAMLSVEGEAEPPEDRPGRRPPLQQDCAALSDAVPRGDQPEAFPRRWAGCPAPRSGSAGAATASGTLQERSESEVLERWNQVRLGVSERQGFCVRDPVPPRPAQPVDASRFPGPCPGSSGDAPRQSSPPGLAGSPWHD